MSLLNASPDPTSVSVIEVKVVEDFILEIAFSNGRSGRHDFSALASRVGPMARPLADPSLFRRAFVQDGVLTWPNGYDWDPASLYREMAAAGEITFEAAE